MSLTWMKVVMAAYAIDILEAANNGQDTDMTLRGGSRVIRVVGALDSWKDNITRAAATR